MSDDPGEQYAGQTTRGHVARLAAEAEAKARHFLATAPHCDICGGQVATYRKRHHSCEPGTLVGKRCTCSPGCTTGDTYGDGPRDCAADCDVCIPRLGQRLTHKR